MPWNEQKGGGGPWGGSGGSSGGSGGNGGSGGSGGGSGGGDKSPWGRPNKPQGSGGGSGGGGDKPDLEESIRRMQERFRRRGGGNGRSGGSGGGRPARGFGATGVIIIIAVAIVGWLMTGIYTVNEQEAAVVLRFGKPERTELAGFHVRFPSPIEEQLIVPVNRSQFTEIGANESESLMLTRDGNIIDVDFAINWKINSPEKYLFKVVDKPNNDPSAPNELIRQVAESAMREVVGNSDFIPLTTSGRGDVEGKVLKIMQDMLSSYDAGIDVISISLKKSQAPPDVLDAQRDVSGAQQEREKRNNEGYSYLNKVTNEAQGEAARIRKEAEGYRDSTIALSTGEAAGFDKLYQEYRKSPESKRVTRERIFLETMERVIGRSNRIIVDTKSGTVPVLPLDTLRPKQQQ